MKFIRFFHYPGKSAMFVKPEAIAHICSVDVQLPDVSYILVGGMQFPIWGGASDIHRVINIIAQTGDIVSAEVVYDRIVDRLTDEQERMKA